MESPISAQIAGRFDLGFILKCSDGRTGELRVPEMSPITRELDSDSARSHIGKVLQVYTILQNHTGSLFSEFSAAERNQRDHRRKQIRDTQRDVIIGTTCNVLITRKLTWGCLCRESDGLLEGVIPAPSTVLDNKWPERELHISESQWESLEQNAIVTVVVARKKEVDWGHIVYLGVTVSSAMSSRTA